MTRVLLVNVVLLPHVQEPVRELSSSFSELGLLTRKAFERVVGKACADALGGNLRLLLDLTSGRGGSSVAQALTVTGRTLSTCTMGRIQVGTTAASTKAVDEAVRQLCPELVNNRIALPSFTSGLLRSALLDELTTIWAGNVKRLLKETPDLLLKLFQKEAVVAPPTSALTHTQNNDATTKYRLVLVGVA